MTTPTTQQHDHQPTSQHLLDHLNQAGQSVLGIGSNIRTQLAHITDATSKLYERLNGGAISHTDLLETAKSIKAATDELNMLDKQLEDVGSQLAGRLKSTHTDVAPAAGVANQQQQRTPGDQPHTLAEKAS